MASQPADTRHRLRVRFRKQGELRFISHRDLLRTVERLFRRAGLVLQTTQGFHPKPRLTFPLALAVGVAAEEEVLELELVEHLSGQQFLEAVRPSCPPGLEFHHAEVLVPGQRKARVASVTYEIALPEQEVDAVEAKIRRWLAADEYLIDREGRAEPIDARPLVVSMEVAGGRLRIILRVDVPVQVRPREILAALGLNELEQQGFELTRTRVDLTPTSSPPPGGGRCNENNKQHVP